MTKDKKFRSAVLGTSLTAIITLILRIYTVTNFVEPESGLYVYGAKAGLFFGLYLALALLLSALCALLVKHIEYPEGSKRSLTATFASSLCGFIFLYNLTHYFTAALGQNRNLYAFVYIVLSALSAAYFFLSSSSKAKANKEMKVLFSVFPIAFFGVHLIEYFTNTSRLMNTSERYISVIAQCAVILFFTYETKLLSEEKKVKNIFGYAFFAVSATVFATGLGLPNLVLSGFWLYKGELASTFYITSIAVGIYAFSGLISLGKKAS